MATGAKSENRLYDHISPCKEKVITVVKIAVTRLNSEWLHGYFLLTGLSKMDFFVSDSPDNHVLYFAWSSKACTNSEKHFSNNENSETLLHYPVVDIRDCYRYFAN